MDIKIQILGIFPSINNNNDKIFFKISNGKLYSLNECIKDNIIIPFFLQYNQDKKSSLPKIEIFLCSKFKNTVSEMSNASFEPFNNETKWITMNNGIKNRFSTYRLKIRCCFSIISSNQKKIHKYCNSMEHTNTNNELMNSLNEDYEKKNTVKKNKKNSINITPTKKKNKNIKEDKGNNYSFLSDSLINKKLDYEKNIPILEKKLRNLMRSEENQMTQDTNIADIQNDDNLMKKKEKKLSEAISENSDINNKDLLIPNNKEISARKIFEQNKIDLFLLYDDDYIKNIQNETKENLKFEVDMILEKLFELSHNYHNAIEKKNERYNYYKNQYYLWLNDFLNIKKIENKFKINTKKKENKIDFNEKSIFNIFNLECHLIKIAGSWDSNQNDKKIKLFEIFCTIILKHNNVLNKKNLNISQLNFILKNVKNYQSSQLQQHQQQMKKKEPQNQLPTKRRKITKHKN